MDFAAATVTQSSDLPAPIWNNGRGIVRFQGNPKPAAEVHAHQISSFAIPPGTQAIMFIRCASPGLPARKVDPEKTCKP